MLARVDVGQVLGDATAGIREYAVYLSYDRDGAAGRGDRGAADILDRRWQGACALAAELEALDPRTIDATQSELVELRALAAQLTWRISRLAVPRVTKTVAGRATVTHMARRFDPDDDPINRTVREDERDYVMPAVGTTTCEQCGRQLPTRAKGRPRQYCDYRCRKRASRMSNAGVTSARIPDTRVG